MPNPIIAMGSSRYDRSKVSFRKDSSAYASITSEEIQMTEYHYPNEVDIEIEDGKRVAYLKPDWREIRQRNERKITNGLSPEECEEIRRRLFDRGGRDGTHG